jgi:hypothetical protein
MAKKKIKASKVRKTTRRAPKKTSWLSSIFRLPHFKLFLALAIFGVIGLSLLSKANVDSFVLGSATSACGSVSGEHCASSCPNGTSNTSTCSMPYQCCKGTAAIACVPGYKRCINNEVEICQNNHWEWSIHNSDGSNAYHCTNNNATCTQAGNNAYCVANTPTPKPSSGCYSNSQCAANQTCKYSSGGYSYCTNLSCPAGQIASNHNCVARSTATPTPKLTVPSKPSPTPMKSCINAFSCRTDQYCSGNYCHNFCAPGYTYVFSKKLCIPNPTPTPIRSSCASVGGTCTQGFQGANPNKCCSNGGWPGGGVLNFCHSSYVSSATCATGTICCKSQ